MFKRIRTPAVNLVMLQTSAEALFCLSHNMAFYNPPETDTDLCRFQGWLINFSLLSSLMFTTSISVYMKATLSRNRREVELNAKNLTTLCVVIFSFASFCASLPFISDQYADLGPKCWIAENEEGRNRKLGVIYRFATHYGIIWALNICLFVCYYEVIKYLRENANQRAARGDDRQIQRTIRILMYYPSKLARLLFYFRGLSHGVFTPFLSFL
jgi:magnesium-transporting ATPase (P-type)